MRKRPSFGRFGELFHDGLPAVAEVGPAHVVNRQGPQFTMSLDSVTSCFIASGGVEPGIDGWHKLTRVDAQCSGKPVTYTMLHHVMYPGAIVTMEKGPLLQLRISFSKSSGAVHVMAPEELSAITSTTADAAFSAFAFYETTAATNPAIVAVAGMAANVVQAGTHFDLTCSRSEKTKVPAKIYIFYPRGLRRIDLRGKPANMTELARLTDDTRSPSNTLRYWLRLGLNEPEAVDEYFRVEPQQERLSVFQVARHTRPRGDHDRYAPLVSASAGNLRSAVIQVSGIRSHHDRNGSSDLQRRAACCRRDHRNPARPDGAARPVARAQL